MPEGNPSVKLPSPHFDASYWTYAAGGRCHSPAFTRTDEEMDGDNLQLEDGAFEAIDNHSAEPTLHSAGDTADVLSCCQDNLRGCGNCINYRRCDDDDCCSPTPQLTTWGHLPQREAPYSAGYAGYPFPWYVTKLTSSSRCAIIALFRLHWRTRSRVGYMQFGSLLLCVILSSISLCRCDDKKVWTAEELTTTRFPYLTSNDIYMDPCKAEGILDGDIALDAEDLRRFPRLQERLASGQSFVDNASDPLMDFSADDFGQLGDLLQSMDDGNQEMWGSAPSVFGQSSNQTDQSYAEHPRHSQFSILETANSTWDEQGFTVISDRRRLHRIRHAAHHKNRRKEKAGKKERLLRSRFKRRTRRAATARHERIWDYGVIPYEIQPNFTGDSQALFMRAMRHWENFTCVTFVPRRPEDINYIVFSIRDCGCCSFVGKRGDGPQAISIGKNCDKFGIVVHELGHVIGFWHEHTRPDRDEFVDIFYKNIQPGQEYNFEKLTSEDVNSLDQPYDYASIMHYARDTFAKLMHKDTILPKPGISSGDRPEIGQRVRLSPGDITQAKLLYNCPKCGHTMMDPRGSFTSPVSNSIQDIVTPVRCQWRIVAAKGERIALNITKLSLPLTPNCGGEDYLVVRDGHYIRSPLLGRFCGSHQDMDTIVSESNRVWIEFKTSGRAPIIPLRDMRKPKREIQSSGYPVRSAGGAEALVGQDFLIPDGFAASYEIYCGGSFTADEGVIESPGYPHDYRRGQKCLWKITVPDNYQVALIFSTFEIESHDDCIYDNLSVYDGHSEDDVRLGNYCGTKMPPSVKSSGTQMLVKFVSDSSVEKNGFSLKFIKEFDECQSGNHGCAHKCVNTLGGYQCECDIGYELHKDGKLCEDACGGYIKLQNGTLTSPNYPHLYPNKKRCIWEIEAHPQYRITLNFTHFDLEGTNQKCQYDFLEISSIDASRNIAKKHGLYCGSIHPPFSLTSETSHLRLEFSTDTSVEKSGFALIYFTDRDECDDNNGGCEQMCQNTVGAYHCDCQSGYILADNGKSCKEVSGGCHEELDHPSGEVQTPNYPDQYSSDKQCFWHFVTTPGHRIQLTFLDFEVEPHQNCVYDGLEFFDGPDKTSPSMGKFCGPKTPKQIVTATNELFMHFYTDNSVNRKGFKATYVSLCGGILQAELRTGKIYSHPSYGGSEYPDKYNCEWIIHGRAGYAVEVRFAQFQLEGDGRKNCDYDFVEVMDGSDRDSRRLIKRLCGDRIPPSMVSSQESLTLVFHTDDSIISKGFVAEYFLREPLDPTPAPFDSGTTTRPPLEPVVNEKIVNLLGNNRN